MDTGQAVIPTWVRADRTQFRDLHAISYVRAHRDRSTRAHGVWDVLEWVTGGSGEAPLGQTRGPVTEATVGEELNRASRARAVNDWASGVHDALAWLAGLVSTPPLEVPRRAMNGRVITWRELAEEARAAAPLRWEPEQAAEAEHRARTEAAHHRVLADLVDLAY